jgi:tetratricopeptide (TPR) repeat protein
MQAHALLTVGTELGRMGKKQEAVFYLESARDLTFKTSSEVVAYIQAYLARAYAEAGERSRSERAIQIALQQAPDHYGNGSHFVYHSRSGLLAEESHVYLMNGQPKKVLAMYERMEQQAKLDGNKRVGAWLPHDASRAHEMLGNLEECVHFAREFFYLAEEMQALHPLKRSIEYVNILAQKYNDVASVRNLSEEVQQLIHDKEHTLPENGEITKSNTPG